LKVVHEENGYRESRRRLGRRTSSPPQFGQVRCIAWAQAPQKVHS